MKIPGISEFFIPVGGDFLFKALVITYDQLNSLLRSFDLVCGACPDGVSV
ncbi:hypothetical protein [Methanogenium cariaci]|nr:hypothetical protein [Methanogenium cariaci]